MFHIIHHVRIIAFNIFLFSSMCYEFWSATRFFHGLLIIFLHKILHIVQMVCYNKDVCLRQRKKRFSF